MEDGLGEGLADGIDLLAAEVLLGGVLEEFMDGGAGAGDGLEDLGLEGDEGGGLRGDGVEEPFSVVKEGALAIATRLAAQGCNVMLNGLGHPDEIEANRKRVEQAGNVRVLFDPADLADPAQVAQLVERTIAEFGGIDILVNNAVVRYFAPIEQFKPQDWDHALAVNLSSAFHTTRMALPGMRQRDFGRIVNMASIYGLRAVVNRVDYVTTKTAMIGFTRAVALETAAQNITCNAVCPGSSPTPSIEQRFADFMATSNLSRAEAEKAREEALQAQHEAARQREEYEEKLTLLQLEAEEAASLREARGRLQPNDPVRVARFDQPGRVVRVDHKRNVALVNGSSASTISTPFQPMSKP